MSVKDVVPTEAARRDFGIEQLDLTEMERDILALTHEVCRKELVPVRAELDEREEFPTGVLATFREIGLFSAMFPEKYGGIGARPILPFLIGETLAEYCLGVTTAFGASTVLAPGPILHGGTPEQKQRYLPRLASGEWLGAFAFTEPEAGSDAGNISTVAEKRGDRYVLNGTKQWITNAGQADLYCVFARTRSGGDPRGGTSCFVVEKDTPGLSFGRVESKMGIRCSHTRQVVLSNVEVPEANLVGGVPHRGFVHAMKSLNRSRILVAAASVGLARAAYREATRYTLERRQFGKKIVQFQVIQHMLVDMLVKIETARLLSYRALQSEVANDPHASAYAAMAKYYGSEIAMEVVTDAVQLHGGNGFSKDYPVEKMFRDAKILAIYEGTSQMMKNEAAGYVIQQAARAS